MAVRRPEAQVAPQEADERLLVEAAQRDPVKFAALYELHFEQVYAYIAHRVADRAAAEDLTSDVFHRALAGLRSYEFRGAPFAAWLIRIAANAIADHSKRAAREVAGQSGDTTEPSHQPDLAAIAHRARLFRLVRELPVDQRRVVFGRFVDQSSIRQLARELGRSEGAVKQLQYRALHSLRAQLEGGHA